jgi:hypothetical protein
VKLAGVPGLAGLIYLDLDPGYEPLRTDSGFHELVKHWGSVSYRYLYSIARWG